MKKHYEVVTTNGWNIKTEKVPAQFAKDEKDAEATVRGLLNTAWMVCEGDTKLVETAGIIKYTYEEAFANMKDMGYDDHDADYEMGHHYKECHSCGDYVKLEDQRRGKCKDC